MNKKKEIIDKLFLLDQTKDSIIKTSQYLNHLSIDPVTVTLVVTTWKEQIMTSLNNSKFIEFMYIANDLIQRSINKRNKEGSC